MRNRVIYMKLNEKTQGASVQKKILENIFSFEGESRKWYKDEYRRIIEENAEVE